MMMMMVVVVMVRMMVLLHDVIRAVRARDAIIGLVTVQIRVVDDAIVGIGGAAARARV